MERRRAIEIRVAEQPSPVGRLGIIEGPSGVLAVCFGSAQQSEALERVGAAFQAPLNVVLTPRVAACRELEEYFAGARRSFDVSLDGSLVSGFKRRVLEALARVPFGELVTYGELARRVGSPHAARAVGAAMRENPLPILVPCHRVVASDGSLGGYSAGLEVKRQLHAVEGIGPLAGGWAPSRGASALGRALDPLASGQPSGGCRRGAESRGA